MEDCTKETIRQCKMAWDRGQKLGLLQGILISFMVYIITGIIVKFLY